MTNTAGICREILLSTYKSVPSYYIKSKLILGTLIIVLPAMSSSCSMIDITGQEESVEYERMIRQSIRLMNHGGIAVRSADIFTFNNDRLQKLDSYQRIDNICSSSFRIATRTGEKRIFICANGGWKQMDWIGINSIEALKETRAKIEDEMWAYPLITGEALFSADDLQNIDVDMKMLAAEIHLRSLSVDFRGKGYEGEKLTDVSVYLTNVNASCSLVPEETVMPEGVINYGGYSEEDIRMMSEPGLIFQEVVSSDHFSNIRLRCYPNSSPEESPGSPFTRLVVEGKISGQTYYWPVNIGREEYGRGVERNCLYTYDLTITGKGSDNPETPVSQNELKINMEVGPWVEKREEIEEF